MALSIVKDTKATRVPLGWYIITQEDKVKTFQMLIMDSKHRKQHLMD